MVSILNLIYLCDFACDVNSEYIKTRQMCVILRWWNFFFDSLSVSWFFMIWVQFEYFGQFLKFRGPFVEFWSGGKQTNSKKNILKYCRKNHVLKIYILNNASKWKMDAIFIIKFLQALGLKLANRTVLWTITLRIFSNFIVIFLQKEKS